MEKLQTMLKKIVGYKIINDGLEYKLTKGFGISTYKDNIYVCGLRFSSTGYGVLLNLILEKLKNLFTIDEIDEIKELIKNDVKRDTKIIMGGF